MLSLGQIMRAVGDAFLRTRATTPFQRKALSAIQRCRTALMGSVFAMCDRCGAEHAVFRSCRNRHCPSCQANARVQWLRARELELLPVPYFHVVFTVPAILNDLALYCPEVFYAALLRAAGNALVDVGRTKLKALLGCLTILHTWGQNLSLHPHVHCVVPGGGFSLDGKRWIAVRNSTYLLPVKVLRRRFKTLLCGYLREAERKGSLVDCRRRCCLMPPSKVHGHKSGLRTSSSRSVARDRYCATWRATHIVWRSAITASSRSGMARSRSGGVTMRIPIDPSSWSSKPPSSCAVF